MCVVCSHHTVSHSAGKRVCHWHRHSQPEVKLLSLSRQTGTALLILTWALLELFDHEKNYNGLSSFSSASSVFSRAAIQLFDAVSGHFVILWTRLFFKFPCSECVSILNMQNAGVLSACQACSWDQRSATPLSVRLIQLVMYRRHPLQFGIILLLLKYLDFMCNFCPFFSYISKKW